MLPVDVREHAIIPNKRNVPVTAVARFLQIRNRNERYVFVTVRILAEKCATEPYARKPTKRYVHAFGENPTICFFRNGVGVKAFF